MTKPKLIFNGQKGTDLTKTEYTRTVPKKWTEDEVAFLVDSKKKGYTTKEIAEAMGRTNTSVSIKAKRIKKQKEHNNYNGPGLEKKYDSNKLFQKWMDPDATILDAYCGVNKYWSQEFENVTTNDKDEAIEADYNLDTFRLLCQLYAEGKKYDFIDLDPFGSAYESFDLAIKMAQKGLIITYGEMGHKRWKRYDFVGLRYGIEKLEDFTLERMIEKTKNIGIRNGKKLTAEVIHEYKNTSRVYYTIEEYKQPPKVRKEPKEYV